MTTLTGSTEATLPGTIEPAPYSAALFGATAQLGTLLFIWSHHSPAEACLGDFAECLGDLAHADPWGRLVIAFEAFAMGCWIFSLRGHWREDPAERFADPSIVDRLWSILPWIICWYFVACDGGGRPGSPRLVLMSVCSTIWGVRLTGNFWIKGGFSGGEDYRWKEVREWFPGIKYEVRNRKTKASLHACWWMPREILRTRASLVVSAECDDFCRALDPCRADFRPGFHPLLPAQRDLGFHRTRCSRLLLERSLEQSGLGCSGVLPSSRGRRGHR